MINAVTELIEMNKAAVRRDSLIVGAIKGPMPLSVPPKAVMAEINNNDVTNGADNRIADHIRKGVMMNALVSKKSGLNQFTNTTPDERIVTATTISVSSRPAELCSLSKECFSAKTKINGVIKIIPVTSPVHQVNHAEK